MLRHCFVQRLAIVHHSVSFYFEGRFQSQVLVHVVEDGSESAYQKFRTPCSDDLRLTEWSRARQAALGYLWNLHIARTSPLLMISSLEVVG